MRRPGPRGRTAVWGAGGGLGMEAWRREEGVVAVLPAFFLLPSVLPSYYSGAFSRGLEIPCSGERETGRESRGSPAGLSGQGQASQERHRVLVGGLPRDGRGPGAPGGGRAHADAQRQVGGKGQCGRAGGAGQKGARERRSGGAPRPQEELWTGVRQQWDEVGGRGRGCSRNGWETWQLARAFDHGGAENRTDSRAPWKAELSGGGHQGAEEEAGVTAEPPGPWAEGARGREGLSLQCRWGIQGERDGQGAHLTRSPD